MHGTVISGYLSSWVTSFYSQRWKRTWISDRCWQGEPVSRYHTFKVGANTYVQGSWRGLASLSTKSSRVMITLLAKESKNRSWALLQWQVKSFCSSMHFRWYETIRSLARDLGSWVHVSSPKYSSETCFNRRQSYLNPKHGDRRKNGFSPSQINFTLLCWPYQQRCPTSTTVMVHHSCSKVMVSMYRTPPNTWSMKRNK